MTRFTRILAAGLVLGITSAAMAQDRDKAPDRETYNKLWDASLKVMKARFFVRYASKTGRRIVAESPLRVRMLDKSRQKVEARIVRDEDFYWDVEVRVTNQVDVSQATSMTRYSPKYDWRAVTFDHDMEAELVNAIKTEAFGAIQPVKGTFMPVGSPKGKTYPTGRVIIPSEASQAAKGKGAQTNYAPPRTPSFLILIFAPKRQPNDKVVPLVVKGERQFREGQYEKASATFREALLTDPLPAVKVALGHALFATGDYAFASASLREGLHDVPDLPRKHIDPREFYGAKKDFDAQEKRLALWIEKHPDDEPAQFLMGYLKYFSGDRGTARVIFDKLLDENHDDAEAKLLRASIVRTAAE